MTQTVNASNPGTVGDAVFNKLSVSSDFPDNLSYLIKDCTAFIDDTHTTDGKHYGIIQVKFGRFVFIFSNVSLGWMLQQSSKSWRRALGLGREPGRFSFQWIHFRSGR